MTDASELDKFEEAVRVVQERIASLEQQLAACRAELEVTRSELASALNEGDALKVKRDGLRKACIFMQARFTTERPALTAKESKEVEAALEPKPEPIAVGEHVGCMRHIEDLERQVAVSRASVKMLQDKVREVQAERTKLRTVVARLDAKAKVADEAAAQIRSQLWSVQATCKAAMEPTK